MKFFNLYDASNRNGKGDLYKARWSVQFPQLVQGTHTGVLAFFFLKLIYLWLQWVFIAPQAFSSCGTWGLPFVAVLGFLMVVPSLVADHRLQACGLGSCGTWAQLLHGMWDLPRPGTEPVSPVVAGRILSTALSGRSRSAFFHVL